MTAITPEAPSRPKVDPAAHAELVRLFRTWNDTVLAWSGAPTWSDLADGLYLDLTILSQAARNRLVAEVPAGHELDLGEGWTVWHGGSTERVHHHVDRAVAQRYQNDQRRRAAAIREQYERTMR